MFEKMNEKDQKTIKMGGLAVLALIVAFSVYQGYDYWTIQKKKAKELNNDLDALKMNDSAHKKLMADVPIFQMPQEDSIQKTNFRNYLNQQFEQLRISTDPWVEVAKPSNAVRPPANYNALSLKTSTRGTARFQDILNLLAALKQNPYYVGIEELKITCDPQNPQLATLSIVLTTFTNNKRAK